MKRLLIIAGGTGGHIFPALAVARKLRNNGIAVSWLGSQRGLEAEWVGTEFPLHAIPISALRGRGIINLLRAPWRLSQATIQAYRIIQAIKPDVILGLGGYVAGPGCLAAWLARIPLVIHEQNAVPGLTNRVLSKLASAVCQAFPQTFSPKSQVITTGNPVRTELLNIPLPHTRLKDRSGPLRILVLGGSQGASALNDVMLQVVQQYPIKNGITVWHQTGSRHYEAVKSSYAKLVSIQNSLPGCAAAEEMPAERGPRPHGAQRARRGGAAGESPQAALATQAPGVTVKVSDFIGNMAEAYCWADLVVCRAGALTVSEIAAVGAACIFIPYPHAVDNHQFHNSQYLVKNNAAIVIPQADLTAARLIELFQQFAQNRDHLITMAENARRLAEPTAAEQVIAQCERSHDIR